jgi:surfactin synthase thioesterase subunit
MRIICLPFAGGTKHSLRFIKKHLPNSVDFLSFDYPGHGNRVKETLLHDVKAISEDIFAQINIGLDENYILYGHSMGALISLLVTQKIIKANLPPPVHLFVSGCEAPAVSTKRLKVDTLSKDEFIEKISRLGGMPEEVLANRDLMEFIEPILRADFKAVDNFSYVKEAPLDIPLTVMVGHGEKMTDEEINHWQDETLQKIRVIKYPGDHFFIYNNEERIVESIISQFKKTAKHKRWIL